jgi:hypothetical protein
MKTTTTQAAYVSETNLTGRQWMSHDGVCTVTECMPSGMYRVVRMDGRVTQMRPSIIVEALAKTGLEPMTLEDLIARSHAAA